MDPVELPLLFLASAAAGVMNSMAGGGTLLTFPTLVFLGLPTITANATSTVALLPGAAGSLVGYRREVAEHRGWLKTLFLPSLVGGALGSWLLLSTPERDFSRVAPLLVLFATGLFTLQGALRRRLVRRRSPAPEGAAGSSRWLLAVVFQLGVAIYGGYFGAGIGILMLAILGFLGLADIHAMNGLKNFFGLAINLVAALIFVLRGAVAWPFALAMAAGAVAGGYGGARLARRIGQGPVRAVVVAIGVTAAIVLFWRQLGI